MKQKEALFHLVKSLSGPEKKYFRNTSNRRSGEKKYLLLFDAVDQMDVYDEKQLRVFLKDEPLLRQLSVAKNYLYANLLKSLRAFHASENLDVQLSEELRNIELLYERGLFAHCRRRLDALYEKAKAHEKHIRLLELLNWRKKLDRIEGYRNLSTERFNALHHEEKETLATMANVREYEALSDQYFLLVAKSADAAQLEIFLRDERLQDERQATSYKSKIFFHIIRARVLHNLGRLRESCAEGDKHIALLEQLPPRLFAEERYNYIVAVYNQLIILTYLKRDAAFAKLLIKLRAVPVQTEKERLTVFYAYLTELDHALARRHYTRGSQLMKPIRDGLAQYADRVNRQVELAFCFNLAYAFVGAGKFRAALSWLNRIINDPQPGPRVDIHCAARLLNLVVHFEIGNSELLENLAGATQRFLQKQDSYGAQEKLLLDYFGGALTQAHSEKEKIAALKKLQRDFSKNKTKGKSALFDFKRWIDQRVQGKTMEGETL